MQIDRCFRAMGARVTITQVPTVVPRRQSRQWQQEAPIVVDVRTDAGGEYFKLTHRSDVALEVLDVRVIDRHVLIAAHLPASSQRGRGAEHAIRTARFLCGRDESHWFVAAIPETAGATDVQAAKDALKPAAVWDALREHRVPADQRDRRRTAAFIRQGEWFFIPRPSLRVEKHQILHDEPIRRGAGKPHACQFLYRIGGQQVMVSDAYPDGLTQEEYWQLPADIRRVQQWRRMTRDAHVYVKGNVRHPDHKTVWLSHWHEVVMNTETEAEAMRHVAFLD